MVTEDLYNFSEYWRADPEGFLTSSRTVLDHYPIGFEIEICLSPDRRFSMSSILYSRDLFDAYLQRLTIAADCQLCGERDRVRPTA
jgi:hypothetical protein